MKIFVVTMIVLLSSVGSANSRQTEFGDCPARYNCDAVIRLTHECVSYRLSEMKTDAAVEHLEQACFEDVKAGR